MRQNGPTVAPVQCVARSRRSLDGLLAMRAVLARLRCGAQSGRGGAERIRAGHAEAIERTEADALMRRHGLTPKRKKWRLLRISWKTHDMLKALKARAPNIPMLEFVEAVVSHIYGGGLVAMQALQFFLIYFDGQPMFIVAAKDVSAAEVGMRAQELGKGIKKITARALSSAPMEDVQRLGIQAILSQLTQVSAALQILLQGR